MSAEMTDAFSISAESGADLDFEVPAGRGHLA
jgi:hypothetical protein